MLLQIQKYLKEREFRKSLQLLSLAKSKWTETEDFVVEDMEVDNMMESEEIERCSQSSQGSRTGSRNGSNNSSQTSESDSFNDRYIIMNFALNLNSSAVNVL